MTDTASIMHKKTRLLIRGMWGIGDNIHQRAVLRELVKQYDIWLDACCVSMFHDLIDQGMNIVRRPWGSGAAARVRDARERAQFDGIRDQVAPSDISERRHIGYDKASIKKHGSILAAQFASVGLSMPERPDFGLPVPQAWKYKAQALLDKLIVNRGDKPLMVYRPIILNNGWICPARAPDLKAYDALYRKVRDRFFVVGIANVVAGYEWIAGPTPEMDLDLTHGELDFESMAGLFSLAEMVFANPGFAPVLAQAVGTPVVIVYGGNECYADTNVVGSHLAPTLAIEPDHPCPCHNRNHNCNKTITLEPAMEKLEEFVDKVIAPLRILIFATTYADTNERVELTKRWLEFHGDLNPECDFLLVDSCSPLGVSDHAPIFPHWGERSDHPLSAWWSLYSFENNIGHLSRNGPGGPSTAGQDGWGRAFCKGLEIAIDGKYDYVVHIEGDSLFRLPVIPIVRQMQKDDLRVLSVPVNGTRRNEVNWVETGLMFFQTKYLFVSDFIKRYDWPGAKRRSTPEAVIFNLLGSHLKMMSWKALRGDKNQITADNVSELDWVTHCRTQGPGIVKLDDIPIYDRFISDTLSGEAAKQEKRRSTVKVNLGCGTNRLPGWENYDSGVDISRKLPFPDNHVDYIFAEHVVEHVDYYTALKFFAECRRVLKPSGMIRITVPSIGNVMRRADEDYIKFVQKWVPGMVGVRAGMHNILFCHGHKAAWTDSLLEASLFYAGFSNLVGCESGQSLNEVFQGVEGHAKVIGERMNWIESISWEGIVDK